MVYRGMLVVAVCALSLGCQNFRCWIAAGICTYPTCPDHIYGSTQAAVTVAATALNGKHQYCFPHDYEKEQLFKDLQSIPSFGDTNLRWLRLAQVKVSTEENYHGYVLKAYRPRTKELLL
jgi:hypothetical protein